MGQWLDERENKTRAEAPKVRQRKLTSQERAARARRLAQRPESSGSDPYLYWRKPFAKRT
jgi:hypothetical protein